MTVEWDKLKAETWKQLHDDVVQYGHVAEALPTQDLAKLLNGQKPAERLKKWVLAHGNTPPVLPPDPVVERDRLPRLCFVGDTHVTHGQDLRRFRWLGQLVEEYLDGPEDQLVLFGDHFNVDGLFYKQSRLHQEGERFNQDRRSGVLARRVLDGELAGFQGKKVILEGNHCARVKKFIADHPYFQGAVDLWEGWDEAGWTVVPFDDGHGFHEAEGWRCQHFVPGKTGRATTSISGNARAVLEKVVRDQSTAFGHTHEYDSWRWEGRHMTVRSVNVGCFFEHHEDYAGVDSNARWWRGCLIVHEAENGDGSIEEWPMSRLRRAFC